MRDKKLNSRFELETFCLQNRCTPSHFIHFSLAKFDASIKFDKCVYFVLKFLKCYIVVGKIYSTIFLGLFSFFELSTGDDKVGFW